MHVQELQSSQNRHYGLHGIASFSIHAQWDLNPVNKEEDTRAPVALYFFEQIPLPYDFYADWHYHRQ